MTANPVSPDNTLNKITRSIHDARSVASANSVGGSCEGMVLFKTLSPFASEPPSLNIRQPVIALLGILMFLLEQETTYVAIRICTLPH
jgi:hypothetical protein